MIVIFLFRSLVIYFSLLVYRLRNFGRNTTVSTNGCFKILKKFNKYFRFKLLSDSNESLSIMHKTLVFTDIINRTIEHV